ncbi:right-handed parallel beta-helix repeat-containing protein [Adhaeribacter sp. BT258]|uniref:Right-handed parallel beta-helix repeat-containing protein n=1 Tax=Adhaeribacter terrigena TaxID=2793070 RepID=A0ABS1C8I0_9BACT|nr:right-handed parallel beta-helix repeat-containing protein [Adhaeribacter terrigena]MBK0404885.1 right-handed parallel beta-helix repeat-containing protein [Adhaeribacter terrigena]
MPQTQAQTPGYSKGAGTGTTLNLFNNPNALKTQFFYLPGDFSPATTPGTISRIYFRNTTAGASGTFTNFKVFMGQTQATVFPGSNSLDFFTGLTQVKNSASLTLTGHATAGGWFFIDLDTPFNYDNTRTLIVEVQIGSFNTGISVHSTSSGVVPAHKKIFASSTAATSGTQDTNGWPNFGIDITPFPACSGTPTAGSAVSSAATTCVGVPFELSVTGSTVASGLTYQWQSSPNGTTWTDITGATTDRYTTSQTATTFYRVNVSCGTNTAPSGSVQVTTTVAPLSGTFTIDKNSPVSTTNYQSFATFVSDVTCKGVSGPVTVNVVSGSGPYNEQVIFTPVPGASTTNTITFNGNSNKISFTGNANNRPTIRLDGADFITLKDLQIEASDSGFGWGIHITNGADNNTISNNTITVASNALLDAANTGIFFTNSTNSATGGNTGNNNIISGNTITGGFVGIYLNSVLTATSNNQIRNNTIKDFISYGIWVKAAKGTLVEGNDISRPTRNLGSEFYGISVSGNSQLTTINKNRVHNTHDAATGTVLSTDVYGIHIQNSDAPAGSENVIKNNLTYNINNTGAIYALYNSGSDGAHFYYNTVNLDNAANTGNLRGFYQINTASNIRFINNIISISAGTGTKHALYFEAPLSVITSNNNVLHIPNGNFGSFAGTDRSTLADWKAVGGGAYDQNSLSANPNFVNITAGNLQPGNSTINNIGQPIAAVTDDITGAARNTTTPDAGAYEFNSPTTNDAGVTSVITPALAVAPGSSTVEIVIKNFGTTPLTTASIAWTVNTVAQTPYTWTGNLAPGTSTSVTIGNYTFVAGPFTLEVCTATPNGQTDGNTSNDCFTLNGTSCIPLAGTYTIDKNSPVSATNYQSITAAVQNLTSCGISAPVIFNVVAGTGPYMEQLNLGTLPGTNAVNTVRFEGNGNTISFASTTSNRPVIRLDGTDFVTINNFQVEASDATYGWGIQLTNGADNNAITNNTVTIAATNTSENNSVGIVFTNSNTLVALPGNTGNNNTFSGNTIIGGYKGIHLNSNANVNSQNRFVNNSIKDFYATGIMISVAKGTLIEGNDISRPVRNLVSNPTIGIYLTDNSTATIISKNRIHNSHIAATTKNGAVYGIYIFNSDAPAGFENIIKNNLVYDINTNGAVYGVYNSGSDGAHIYHNTLDLGHAASTGALRGYFQNSPVTNARFINNIVSITAGTGAKYALYFDNATSSITSNNNVLFVPGGNIGFLGTAKATLADWKAANSNAYDQNSVSDDPSYANLITGNLQPTSGLINNIGQPLATVTDDIAGAPRNVATPDAGAYEFGTAQDDAGVIAISGPATSGCGLSNAETIIVTIKNFGSVTQTSVPVTFSINGTTIATETFTGSLLGNATASYTFTAKANMSVPGPYLIVAKTVMPNDGNASNDADTISHPNALFSTLPVTLDFETTNTGLPMLKTMVGKQAKITEGTGASNGTGSAKGLIMDGVASFNWTLPVGTTNPWTANPDNFAGAYFCITPGVGNPKDSLYLSFDLKQLFRSVNANTNFRVTVNGTQVGPTYRPPFSGTPINWQKIKVDLTSYLSQSTIEIGLESDVKEEYDNGNGTANLIDNINVVRIAAPNTGISENILQNNIAVYPNPSAGLFNLKVPASLGSYSVEVTDLAGRVVKREVVTNHSGTQQLNLSGTAKGIYVLKIASEGNVATRKLIVE